ncbi:hypothetical protein BKK52_07325 [Rodentibacter trehalosifermentans]|uniref:Uncharacterized protein n=1 Tax=Rodentibacter trehalosifermentans TaxID=1908263 RepID=A0A1V3IZN6_9PAST|nr:hypothetical protein [Rodentibacter trehalosifermentans]OOF47957.1 hypothetical protein BKK52_07325 [Rodentibacter trehalosifermentans]
MEFILTFLLFVFGLSFVVAMAMGGVAIVGYLALAVIALAIRFWYIALGIMLLMIAPLFYLNDWLIYVLYAVLFYAALTVLWYVVNWLNKQLDRLNQKLS